MTTLSLAFAKSLFYVIAKYLFVSLSLIALTFYSLYIMSDDSLDVK